MSMFRLPRQLTIGLLTLAITCAVAIASRNETCVEFLKRQGIEVTEKGLIVALRNPDPHIRDNAAMALADEKLAAAVPAVKEAMTAEKDPWLKVNLAEDLARLGAKDGFVALKNFCDTASPDQRLKAALYMLRFGDESCLSAVQSVLRSEPEGDHLYVASALSLIPSFHKLNATEKRELCVLTLKWLADPEPSIRLTASEVLGKIDDADVIPSLEKAIADEANPVVRDWMERELDRAKAKNNH